MNDDSVRARHPLLIVDDEPEILFSLRGLLRQDFEVHTAESGAQALEILAREPIHVVMSDQRMPGMTGVELLNHVRATHPAVVRLIFTGYADINAVIEAINMGSVYRYLTKPWEPHQLTSVLMSACERFEQIEERNRLLQDLRRTQRQYVALFDALKEGRFGQLSGLGRVEAARLAGNSRGLLESLDRVLLRASEKAID